MNWWIPAAVIVVVVLFIDWFIVMGINSKKWKGGGRHD